MADKKILDLAGALTAAQVDTANDAFVVADYSDTGIAKTITPAEVRTLAKAGNTASRAVETDASGNIGASSTTAAELATLHSVTAGTAAANKAAVLGASKDIDEIDITTLKIGGTTVTSTADELNTTDGAVGYVRGLQQGLSRPGGASIVGDARLTYTQAGHHAAGLSGVDITVTLPSLSACGLSAPFAFAVAANTGGDDLIIIDDSADGGFGDGATTGTQIVLTTVGAYVLLRATGVAGGKWAVCGGWGYTIS